LRAGASEERGDEHRLLAGMLTGALSRLPDGTERAEVAGRAWGRFLVKRPLRFARTTDRKAVREVVSVLEQQGFAPKADGREIRMRRCSFHDLAETNPEIVCVAHCGLISGALDELGATSTWARWSSSSSPTCASPGSRRAGVSFCGTARSSRARPWPAG
jgi:predicted ArsR family transcriptional regulator